MAHNLKSEGIKVNGRNSIQQVNHTNLQTGSLYDNLTFLSNISGDKLLLNFGAKFQHSFIISQLATIRTCQDGGKVLSVMNGDFKA